MLMLMLMLMQQRLGKELAQVMTAQFDQLQGQEHGDGLLSHLALQAAKRPQARQALNLPAPRPPSLRPATRHRPVRAA